ncbi:MAG TPA: AraC family transcriptional regulator, partial [Ramlibacter sp.]|nr:AraC family transcriptional regulator [Ramlibacter sp.]
QDARLQRATHRLLDALRAWQRQGDALACEEALVQACGRLLERHTTRPAAPNAPAVRLDHIRQRLADDLLHPPTLEELACEAGIGKFQLLRRFAALYGCTPHAFVQQQRAERVRRWIRHGSSLADAAAAAGFADQPHMTRVFTRHFGFTPGAWQRASRAQ